MKSTQKEKRTPPINSTADNRAKRISMRSFGGGGSRGMGGGASGGGSMQILKTVQRAVRTRAVGSGGSGAAHEPFSHTQSSTTRNTRIAKQTTFNNNNNQPITLSSSSSATSSVTFSPSTISTAVSPAWPSSSSCSSPTLADESDWECIDDYEDFIFRTVPSKDEASHAVFALQQVLDPASPKYLINERLENNLDTEIGDQISSPTGSPKRSSPFGTELDWTEPSLHLWNQSMLQAYERVYDAFHLLQNEPSVQKMVISLSSDNAVWDAVLNNEVVQELRESFTQDKSPLEKSDDDGSVDSDPARDFLSWIIVNTKAKLIELIDKITGLVNELFHIEEGEKTADRKADPFEERLRASFLLSVVVMLIVVVTRSSKA